MIWMILISEGLKRILVRFRQIVCAIVVEPGLDGAGIVDVVLLGEVAGDDTRIGRHHAERGDALGVLLLGDVVVAVLVDVNEVVRRHLCVALLGRLNVLGDGGLCL